MGTAEQQIIDEILVMDCQSGGAKALELLISRWQKRFWRHAHYLTADADAAWDVTQESWLGIIKGIRRLNDPARFKAWAYRIVTNKANDWIRRNKMQPRRDIEPADQVDPKSEEGVNDTANDLHSLVRRLPAHCRAVLSLYYIEGFALAEVARVLRVPKGTVKSRLHTARNELKELWQQHAEEQEL